MTPDWLLPAFDELVAGVAEVPGPGVNSRIALYDQGVGLAADDATPWCAAFCNWALAQAGVKGTGKPNARSFVTWGTPCDPKLGAIVVFWRGAQDGWMGHVGFVLGFGRGYIIVLGGNQGDAVSIELFTTDRVIGCRWPAPPPTEHI